MAPTKTRQGFAPGTPAIDNLDPTLRDIALRIVAESGGRVWIGSGWRSNQQQSSLYNRWISGNYDVPAVARPGTSHHEHGGAVDFGGDLRLAQQLGRQYGLIFPVDGEAWHAELGEGVGGGQDFGGMGIHYNFNYGSSTKPLKPEDILANRMNSIMSSLGGGQFSSGANQMLDPMMAAKQFTQPATESASAQDVIAPQSDMGMGIGSQQPDLFPSQYSMARVNGTSPQDMSVDFVPGGDKAQLGQYAKSLFSQFGFDESDYPALVELWNKESGDPRAGPNAVTWNPLAQNSTSSAFGIAQFLNGTWAGTGISKTTNPMQQIMAGLTYIKAQYQNPRNALAFHRRNNWY